MIGHRQIIAARLDGLRPRTVFVEVGMPPSLETFDFDKYENALKWNLYPTVNIPPAEVRERHDFRFLLGCTVIASAENLTDEVLEVCERIVEAGAKHLVVSGLEDKAIVQFKNNEWEAFA